MAGKAGQIIPRGERTWLVRVFMGRDSDSGKRKYVNKTVHGTLRDAQAYLSRTQRDRDLGVFFEPSRMTLDGYLDKWLETAAKPKLRAKTHRDYEALLRRYVRPALGSRQASKIEPLEIQGLYADMQERGLSARTVRFTHAVLRAALQQAVKWKLIPQNPALSVDLPKQAKGEIQVLNPQQAREFLKEAVEDRYHVLFAVALTTGLRPSEYLALKWPDVNSSKGTISVARTLEPIKGGGWRFADTKRARSRRLVKLQASVLKLLSEYRDSQAEERAAANGDAATADLIFVNTSGNPLNERNLVQRNFQVILERAKLPRIRLYDLRHTAATLALAAGVPAKVVSEQLGHASVAFTLDTYSHVLPHMQEAAAAQVEALLFETASKKRATRKKKRATGDKMKREQK
jgi:integrase